MGSGPQTPSTTFSRVSSRPCLDPFSHPMTPICMSRSKPTSNPCDWKPARIKTIPLTTHLLFCVSPLQVRPNGRRFKTSTLMAMATLSFSRVSLPETIPDGFGGVLAAWTYVSPHLRSGKQLISESRLSHIGPSGQQDFTLPMLFWTKGINTLFDENMVLGDGNVLYATNGPLLVRFDTQAGVLDWGVILQQERSNCA